MKKILGIDPGSKKLGWAIIEKEGSNSKYIKSGKIEALGRISFDKRLVEMHDNVAKIMSDYEPDYVAIETVFVKINPKVSMMLSQLVGVIVLAATKQDIPIMYVTTPEAKTYVAGTSRATKEEVAKKVIEFTKKRALKKVTLDETDAIAVGFTAASRLNESIFS